MKIVGTELHLQCTGTDAGIAIDRIGGEIPAGPYSLPFRVKSESGGGSEIYYTIDRETKLPRGRHLELEVLHDGRWHEQAVPLETTKQLHALRLDIGNQAGSVVIADLRLTDSHGQTIARWPRGK